jgi:hypothetical protein
MCRVLRLDYCFATRTARLFFPPYQFCDMAGAIKLVTAIDGAAVLIETYAGREADTVYRRPHSRADWRTNIR